MKIRRGTCLCIAGTILLIAALFLLLYNRGEDSHVRKVTNEVLDELKDQMPEAHYEESTEYAMEGIYTTIPTENSTGDSLAQSRTKPAPEEPDIFAEYEDQEQTETTEIVYWVDNWSYMGVLYIPSLGLELPVISDWSYPALRTAPSRYSGSVEGKDLIIAAHNYRCHFGRISELDSGDEIIFTDANGVMHSYSVIQSDLIGGRNTNAMLSGSDEWDLTLFTCTIGGASRVTVRAVLNE